MSYEGYSQFWCKNGHYWTLDCYQDSSKVCPTCGKKEIYEHMVDTTNDEGNPYCVVLDKKKSKFCKCCKNLLQGIYKIPKSLTPRR